MVATGLIWLEAPGVAVLATSCRAGEGVDDVATWLAWRIATKQAATVEQRGGR